MIAQLANMLRPRRDGKGYRAEEFLLEFKEAEQISTEQSQANVEAMIKTWVAAANIQHRREMKAKGAQDS